MPQTPAADLHRSPDRRSRVLGGVSWGGAILALAAWVVARVGWLTHSYLIAAAALGPVWVLVAFVASCRRGRHRWAAGAAVVLWASVAISGIAAASGPEPHGGISILASNLLLYNDQPAAAVERVLAVDADVLITSETTPLMAALIRSSGRYQVSLQGLGHAADVYIWGRDGAWPDGHVHAGTRGFPRLQVADLEIVGIHVNSPAVEHGRSRWAAEYKALDTYAAGRENLVLAGDFNASLEHRPLQALGLRAGSRAGGVPFPRTWPAWAPVIGIDHVLVAGQVAVGGYHQVLVPGSDHRAVAARVERITR